MIEDPKLTLRILEYFADEAVGFPANKLVEDLVGVLPDVGVEDLRYHVICAIDGDLLHGNYTAQGQITGTVYTVDFLAGLTQKGGEYVRASGNKKYFDEACNKIRAMGFTVTTQLLCDYLPKLISEALHSS